MAAAWLPDQSPTGCLGTGNRGEQSGGKQVRVPGHVVPPRYHSITRASPSWLCCGERLSLVSLREHSLGLRSKSWSHLSEDLSYPNSEDRCRGHSNLLKHPAILWLNQKTKPRAKPKVALQGFVLNLASSFSETLPLNLLHIPRAKQTNGPSTDLSREHLTAAEQEICCVFRHVK